VLARLGPRLDTVSLPWVHSGEHRSPRFAAWAERLWRRPLPYGALALALLVALALPVLKLDTGMPSIKVVPQQDGSHQGYEQVQAAFGPGAPGALQIVAPAAETEAVAAAAGRDPGIAAVTPPQTGAGGLALIQALPRQDPSDEAVGATVDRLRDRLPEGALVGGAAAENHDLEQALKRRTPS
jgi:putative drug exporter of the RND superfamily